MMAAEPNWSALERAYEYRIERERNRQAEDRDMHDLDDPYARGVGRTPRWAKIRRGYQGGNGR